MGGKVSKFHNVISCLNTPNTNKLRPARISVPLCGDMPDQRRQRMTEQWCGEATLGCHYHYDDVIMSTIASHITSLAVVYSTVYSDANQRKHQSSASLAFVWGIHHDRWIPRTKGQLRGKCFHLMTSSWRGITYCMISPVLPLPDALKLTIANHKKIIQITACVHNSCIGALYNTINRYESSDLSTLFSNGQSCLRLLSGLANDIMHCILFLDVWCLRETTMHPEQPSHQMLCGGPWLPSVIQDTPRIAYSAGCCVKTCNRADQLWQARVRPSLWKSLQIGD